MGNGRRNRLPHLAGSIVWRSRWGRRFACRWKLISIAHPNPENGYAPHAPHRGCTFTYIHVILSKDILGDNDPLEAVMRATLLLVTVSLAFAETKMPPSA